MNLCPLLFDPLHVPFSSSGQVEHVMFLQDPLGSDVNRFQSLNDKLQDGDGVLLPPHAHQLQEELPVWESEEDELGRPAQHPGVVRG